MPYYVYEQGIKDEPQEQARIAAFTKRDALLLRAKGESIAFIPTQQESSAWRDREYRRLYGAGGSGKEYQPLPFGTPWEHFAHRAKDDPEKISYTPDETFGHEDRRLVTTPVRYLEKYADLINYSRDQFAELAGKMRAGAMALQVADTAETIARVYCAPGGPISCMNGSDFDLDNTPVRAYAGGDLAVAYLGKLGANPGDDRIHARAIVWRERKQWVRAYGDIDAIAAALKSEGYRQVGSWQGARLKAIHADNSRRYWVVPYIDGSVQCLGHDGGDWLIVGAGLIDGTNTSGRSAVVVSNPCANCCNPRLEGEAYCESCLEDSFICSHCEEPAFGDAEFIGDEAWCHSCYRQQRATCSHCGDRFNTAGSESADYCDGCYENVVSCSHCNTTDHSDTLQLANHGDREDVCLDCRQYLSRPRGSRPVHMIVRNGTVTFSASSRWNSLLAWVERAR